MTRFEALSGGVLDKLYKQKIAPIEAIPTPFPGWNAICGEEGGKQGIAKRWVIVLGGVTGTGKSYLAKNLAAAAVRQGRKVGMVNFEMSQMAVATRYLSILTGIPKWKLEMGEHFNEKAWIKAKKIADQIQQDTGGCLIANESAVFDLSDIEESYDALVDAGCEMIVVDYAQLVGVQGTDGIYQRSEAVATRLRELTHEYKIATVAISQFNREEAKRGKPPSIHGLMGGGIWEHAANQIWLLNHTVRMKYGSTPSGAPEGEFTQLLCGKNRHGIAPVELPMRWSYEDMRFEEYVPQPGEAHPFDEPDKEVVVDTPPSKEYSTETRDLFEDEDDDPLKEE